MFDFILLLSVFHLFKEVSRRVKSTAFVLPNYERRACMLTELTPLFKRPPLYTKTEIPFRDDEHISLQMLNAHLNPNYDGASRKLEFIDQSVNWISKILSQKMIHRYLILDVVPVFILSDTQKRGIRS